MTANFKTQPTIVVDLERGLIRIHKRTIHSLGDPKNILLLVNPYERTLGVICCDKGEQGSHPIKLELLRKNCYELHSKPLIGSLRTVFTKWEDGEKYRMIGELFPMKRAIRFNMADYKPIINMEC